MGEIAGALSPPRPPPLVGISRETFKTFKTRLDAQLSIPIRDVLLRLNLQMCDLL